ncbi:hypothetical protein [Nostoc sp.]|uniref:hypothetical protein n=1 Tax=Nostoc sp. TaxID=1180 RepID=UPI002FF95B99
MSKKVEVPSSKLERSSKKVEVPSSEQQALGSEVKMPSSKVGSWYFESDRPVVDYKNFLCKGFKTA